MLARKLRRRRAIDRSITQEVERRLEQSFAFAPDLRTLIREEILAALAERDNPGDGFVGRRIGDALVSISPHAHALVMPDGGYSCGGMTVQPDDDRYRY